MKETSTTEKLILYLFNETALTDTVLVQKAIDEDPETECEFENLKATLAVLDHMLVSAPERAIGQILSYSASHFHQ